MYSIQELKISADDPWKKAWVKKYGTSVYTSPDFVYYSQGIEPIKDWKALTPYRLQRLDLVIMSIDHWGQLKPIKVCDKIIVTGHKRAAAMAYLGYKEIA